MRKDIRLEPERTTLARLQWLQKYIVKGDLKLLKPLSEYFIRNHESPSVLAFFLNHSQLHGNKSHFHDTWSHEIDSAWDIDRDEGGRFVHVVKHTIVPTSNVKYNYEGKMYYNDG